jgi:hypothetical protein
LSNQDFSSVASWDFFPNPSRGRITMNIPQTLLGEEVEIYNLLGKRVWKHRVEVSPLQMELSNLARGQYLVRITNHSNTQKLILK